MTDESEIEAALDKLQSTIAGIPGVQGVGFREDDNGPFFTVYVDAKRPEHSQIAATSTLGDGASAKRIPVRIFEIGEMQLL